MAFRKCPNYPDIIPSEENPQGKRISQQIPQKRFSLQKKSYPPAGLFQITIFRRCDPRTRTWSDSASEYYASSSFPFERASELPATFHSQVIIKDPSTEYHDSQRISPAGDTQTRQKIINNHNIVISR